jgi:hypothetical protein
MAVILGSVVRNSLIDDTHPLNTRHTDDDTLRKPVEQPPPSLDQDSVDEQHYRLRGIAPREERREQREDADATRRTEATQASARTHTPAVGRVSTVEHTGVRSRVHVPVATTKRSGHYLAVASKPFGSASTAMDRNGRPALESNVVQSVFERR